MADLTGREQTLDEWMSSALLSDPRFPNDEGLKELARVCAYCAMGFHGKTRDGVTDNCNCRCHA